MLLHWIKNKENVNFSHFQNAGFLLIKQTEKSTIFVSIKKVKYAVYFLILQDYIQN